jgi:galactokinase
VSGWDARLAALGLSPDGAALASTYFTDVAARHVREFGDDGSARAWWIPGRIEVLGKHTDYGGGRSLLCAVERGFHVVAAPRPDAVIQILDASTRAAVTIPFDPDAPPRPGHWTDYPISVARRVARDFLDARTGMNMVIRSSLPSAAGLSSSSALVIATFLPLAAINDLRSRPPWRVIPGDDALAEYVGAMENGRAYGPFAADRGVGTQGGSEDQTAILRSVPGQLLRYHFIPVTPEEIVPLPAGWTFAIAMSGVHAAKGAAVQARYNALAQEVAGLLALWCRRSGRTDRSLFGALHSDPDAATRFAAMLAADSSVPDAWRIRLEQFREECDQIIPEVSRLLQLGDVVAIGELVARSQANAETALRNQLPETIHLAGAARRLGAAAGSAFGAGFGGSVWALVPVADAAAFLQRWRDDYLAAFPDRRTRAEFFASAPGPAACEVGPISR